MSDKPKRRDWQIHLSTAIVLMPIASAFMWINSVPHKGLEVINGHFESSFLAGYGYPLIYAYAYPPESFEEPTKIGSWIVDVIFAIAISFISTVLCEYLIRRFEARNQ